MKNRIGSKSPLSKELLLVVIGAAVALGPAGMGLINSRFAAAPVSLIPVRMQEFVDRHQAAGIVTLVARHGDLKEFDAVGYQDLETNKPMRKDSIFQIMSMTKPITCVGVMVLEEEGKLSVGAPVARYLPEFDGKNITLRDLMTHTSGLPQYPTGALKDLYQKMDRTLAEAVTAYATYPLSFEPGTKWQYSNPGIATLGRIIEVVSGQPYEKFIESRILAPLQMKDSFFFPTADKISRIAMVYKLVNLPFLLSSYDRLERSGAEILGGDPALYRKGAKYPAPEFGMFSTATDLWHFYEMMRNHGTWNDVRILSPASVEVMTMLHTGSIEPSDWFLGGGYGLGFDVMKDARGTLNLMSIGSYGHGGVLSTHAWVDPKKDLVGIFLISRSGQLREARDAFFAMAASGE